MKEAIHQSLEDTEKFGMTFVAGLDPGDRQVLLQLKERRVRRHIQREVAVPWECVTVIEWSGADRLVHDFRDAAGSLGAKIEENDDQGPVLLCATVGPDVHGKQLRRIFQLVKDKGAWLAMIEGPGACAWTLGQQWCEKEGWTV